EIATRLESGKEVDLAASELSTQRSHYDMVLERRSKKELEVLLQEVLVDMRKRRSEGRLTA
ncbi:RNA polymerase-binding protein RbpA, partial [bacterium]|nr:RNA polymerase-binding protein RbpA [bacterium]